MLTPDQTFAFFIIVPSFSFGMGITIGWMCKTYLANKKLAALEEELEKESYEVNFLKKLLGEVDEQAKEISGQTRFGLLASVEALVKAANCKDIERITDRFLDLEYRDRVWQEFLRDAGLSLAGDAERYAYPGEILEWAKRAKAQLDGIENFCREVSVRMGCTPTFLKSLDDVARQIENLYESPAIVRAIGREYKLEYYKNMLRRMPSCLPKLYVTVLEAFNEGQAKLFRFENEETLTSGDYAQLFVRCPIGEKKEIFFRLSDIGYSALVSLERDGDLPPLNLQREEEGPAEV